MVSRLAIASSWNQASLSERVAFCGAVLFWITLICTPSESMDPRFDLFVDVMGLVVTLLTGLRERKLVVVTTLGLHTTGQVEESGPS